MSFTTGGVNFLAISACLVLVNFKAACRPSNPMEWWEDSCQILGGKDCVAGGTWMACTRDGRLAFLTNVREPNPSLHAKSRGVLPQRFLESDKTPLEFAEEVVKEADQYNGFNLVLTDLCSNSMICVSNRPIGQPVSVQRVLPGLHVLSNASLDTPWHKAQRLGQNFKNLLHKYGEEDVREKELVEKLMGDTVKADREKLPNTGVDPEWELKLSSIFVEADTKQGLYGTRSTAALIVKAGGEVNFYEKYLEKGIWKDHTISYQIDRVM